MALNSLKTKTLFLFERLIRGKPKCTCFLCEYLCSLAQSIQMILHQPTFGNDDLPFCACNENIDANRISSSKCSIHSGLFLDVVSYKLYFFRRFALCTGFQIDFDMGSQNFQWFLFYSIEHHTLDNYELGIVWSFGVLLVC